jgi:large subunit ribosomal protein L32e
MSKAYKRISESWRRPKGSQSKVRRREKGKLKMPSIGYRKPKSIRGLHPSGYKEVLIYNKKDLERLDPKKEAVRIAATVGKKKRMEILKVAEKMKLKILNP